MIPEKYKLLVAGTGLSKVYFYFFSSILVIFFEMLGIGLVPLFALIIVDTDNTLSKIFEYFNYEINYEINRKLIIFIFGAFFLLVFLIKNLALTIVTYLQLKIIQIFKTNAASKLYKYYLDSDFSFFLKSNPSEMIRAFDGDIAYAYGYFLAKIKLLRESILVIIILGTLILIDPIIYSLSFLLLFIATIIFYYFYKKTLKFRAVLLREKQAERYKIISQTFHSIKEVKVLNKENFFKNFFNQTNYVVENLSFITNFVTSLPKMVFETLAVFSIITFSVLLVFLDKPESVVLSIISLLVAAGARFIPAFGVITQSMGTIRFMQPQFNNIVDALGKLKQSEKKVNEVSNKKLQINFFKNIKIENVSFGYTNKNVIEGLSLSIDKGQTIGIIGSSGVTTVFISNATESLTFSTILNLVFKFTAEGSGLYNFNSTALVSLNSSVSIFTIE